MMTTLITTLADQRPTRGGRVGLSIHAEKAARARAGLSPLGG